MANFATKQAVESTQKLRIHVPLIHLSKAQIIAKGLELGVDFALSSTCYQPTEDGEACGSCDACSLRRQGFAEVGIPDPVRYAIQQG